MVRIAIIGAGNVGGALARHFAAAGHEVAVSNSRGPETLADLVTELGDKARALTPAEAAEFGDVAVVSVPLFHYRDVPAEALAGKIVIDTSNYYPSRDGQLDELDSDSVTSSELIAAHLEGARVVKAFNQIAATHLADDALPAGDPNRTVIPIAGDDEDAKTRVAQLVDSIGFDSVDVGGLADSRIIQPGGPLFVQVTSEGAAKILASR